MEKLLDHEPKIYENIKRIREMKNISRQQMAEDLDLSLSGYSKLERGEIDVTLHRIKQISAILGVELSQLLNFDATQVFNVSNNNVIQGIGTKASSVHYHSDEYLIKYVKVLEAENERLKKELGLI